MSEITDKIDRFGHCVCCGDNLLTKRVVDGKVVDMFLPTYDETMFLLSNGSQMQVTICKKCKFSIDFTENEVKRNIMAAVQKGWELESNLMVADESKPEWTKEVGDKYLDTMSKLDIDCRSENLSKHIIQAKSIELAGLNIEELPVIKE